MVKRKIVIFGSILILLIMFFYLTDNFVISSKVNSGNSNVEVLIYNGTGAMESSVDGIDCLLYTSRHPLIPRRIMEYKISQNNMLKILNGMNTVLTKFERVTKPRLTVLAGKENMVYVNSSVMIFCSFLLMLPLPVPLTDFLPAYSMLFLALGTIERDGYLIVAGYALAVITTIYFLLIAILGLAGIKLVLSFLGINF